MTSIKNTVRKFNSCRVSSRHSDDQGSKQRLRALDYNSRHALYDQRRKQTLKKMQKFRSESSHMNRISVNTALSMIQWRSTPSPKPLRTNWCNLPATAVSAAICMKPSRQKGSNGEVSPSHIKQRIRNPLLPPFPRRPLTTQTAERHNLRVRNCTVEDGLVNAPLLPYTGALATSSDAQDIHAESRANKNADAENARVDFNKPLPAQPVAPRDTTLAPNPPIVNQKFRSSIPRPIKRKDVPSRLPVSAKVSKSFRQPSPSLQIQRAATLADEVFKTDPETVLTNPKDTPKESTRGSKRMGMIFPPTGLDMRDLPTELSILSPQGDGSRFPIHEPATGWIPNAESIPSESNPDHIAPLVIRKQSKRYAQGYQRPRNNLKSDPRTQETSISTGGHKRRSALLKTQKRQCIYSSYVDSSTQTEQPGPIEGVVPFYGTLDGKRFKGCSSFTIDPPQKPWEAFQMVHVDTSIFLNPLGKEASDSTEARETITAQTDSFDAKASQNRHSRPRLSVMIPAEPTLPIESVLSSPQSSFKAPIQTHQPPMEIPTSLIPGQGRRLQKRFELPVPAQNIHPPSLTPGHQPTSTASPTQPPSLPTSLIPGRTAKRARYNRPYAPSSSSASTISALTPLTLNLPDSQHDTSSAAGPADAPYSYVEPAPQDFSRPTSYRRRKNSPRWRMGPPQLRPMTRLEVAYEHLFRLES